MKKVYPKVLYLFSLIFLIVVLPGCYNGVIPNGISSDYNTPVLRYDANFKVKVSEGVYWVPANTLGYPKYTMEELRNLDRSPENLKNKISTLYEVIAYIEAVDFKGASDNIRIEENGISWEHHKPGEMAIITNEGCCATISNLMNYLLKDDYEEVGFIAFTRTGGGGHVFNYIKKGDKYYFIDLNHFRNDFLNAAIEDGNLNTYCPANLHEADSIESYINYCMSIYNEKPRLWSVYTADNVLPIGIWISNNPEIEMLYPRKSEPLMRYIYDPPGDNHSYVFCDPPTIYPEVWEPYNTHWDK